VRADPAAGYELQAIGEFVYLRSDAFEVQAVFEGAKGPRDGYVRDGRSRRRSRD
jgi:hypothetical protein